MFNKFVISNYLRFTWIYSDLIRIYLDITKELLPKQKLGTVLCISLDLQSFIHDFLRIYLGLLRMHLEEFT